MSKQNSDGLKNIFKVMLLRRQTAEVTDELQVLGQLMESKKERYLPENQITLR